MTDQTELIATMEALIQAKELNLKNGHGTSVIDAMIDDLAQKIAGQTPKEKTFDDVKNAAYFDYCLNMTNTAQAWGTAKARRELISEGKVWTVLAKNNRTNDGWFWWNGDSHSVTCLARDLQFNNFDVYVFDAQKRRYTHKL